LPPPDTLLDLPDFLRRLSIMMTGGRNAEMAALAANEIEALRQRVATAELASGNLIAEVAVLKAERDAAKQALDAERGQLESEIHRLQAEVKDSEARAADFAADMKTHIGELGAAADARVAALAAEVEELRSQQQTIDETIAVVPVEQLRLARVQFDYLAQAFASSGDVISLTICQIGANAIDKALGVNDGETDGLATAAAREV
jgi:chromosome segregation ATPase